MLYRYRKSWTKQEKKKQTAALACKIHICTSPTLICYEYFSILIWQMNDHAMCRNKMRAISRPPWKIVWILCVSMKMLFKWLYKWMHSHESKWYSLTWLLFKKEKKWKKLNTFTNKHIKRRIACILFLQPNHNFPRNPLLIITLCVKRTRRIRNNKILHTYS